MLSVGIGFIPGVGDAYDLVSATLGYDLITGEKLAWWERGLALAPLAGVGVGILASVLADAGRMAGRLDEAADLARTTEQLADLADDEWVEQLVRHGDAGDLIGTLRRGDDVIPPGRALVPYDPYEAARRLNFTDRLTGAIEENLRAGKGRHILIELSELGDESVGLKPAARYLEGIVPYKGTELKHLKSDALGFVRDPDTDKVLAISDPDLMAIIEEGRILSNVDTEKLVDALNDSWLRWNSPVGETLEETHVPFKHPARATYHEVSKDPKAMEIPKHTADFYLDDQGRLRVDVISGEGQYLDYIENLVEDLSDFPWYTRARSGR